MPSRYDFFMQRRQVRNVARDLLDLILPPMDARDTQSGDWADIRFLDAPFCATCGFPFETQAEALALCASCAVRPPKYDRGRAALEYNDASRGLILAFKHGGRTENLGLFAAQMVRAGRDILPKADWLIPVPLHPTRLIRRRYNQSLLLARALSKRAKVRVEVDSLRRVKRTLTQGGRSASARRANVQGAFAVDRADRVKGARIILIDDVMTTGATLNAAAMTLKRAGAAQVDALCLSRVVRPQKPPT